MSYLVRISLSSALVLGISSAAQADIDPQDVWDAWQKEYAHTGQTFSAGSIDEKRKQVTLHDVSSVMESDTSRIEFKVEQIEMRAVRGGKVEITISPEITFSATNEIDDERRSEMGGTILLGKHSMIASGDPDQINYEIDASKISVDMQSSIDDGATMVADIDFVLEGIAGVYETKAVEDGILPARVDLNVAKYTVDVTSDMEEPKGKLHLTGEMADYKILGDFKFPENSVKGGFSDWIKGGAIFDATYSTGAGNFDFDADSGPKSVQGKVAISSSSVEMAMASDAVSYSGEVLGLDFSAQGPGIPIPQISGALSRYGFGVKMPLGVSEEPQDFAMNIALSDLTLGEDVWALFDPTKGLPRDPAQLDLAFSGKGNFLIDIFDPEATKDAAQSMTPPGVLNEFAIDRLKLAVAGALLTGHGSATFDPEVQGEGGSFPAPDGTLNLALTGGNGLMTKLTEIGLLPAEQAMGAQMMLGLFTKPGEGPDSLTTKLKATADGALYANGQRFK